MATALGIAQVTDGDGNVTGTDPLQLRKIIQARWASTGIVTGLTAAGRADLKYDVGAGVAICSRGDADGYTEAYWPGGQTAAVAAGDASNPRIDVIWIRANDAQQGDADNQVVIGVAQGTAAASPTVPAVPAGATAIGTFRVPAGATSTKAATKTDTPAYAIPYGASAGVLATATDTSTGLGSGSWYTYVQTSFTLVTRRWVSYEITTALQGVVPDVGTATDGSCYMQLLVDNNPIMSIERILNPAASTHYFSQTIKTGAGKHTVALQMKDGLCGFKRYYSGDGWPGQVITIFDQGVA